MKGLTKQGYITMTDPAIPYRRILRHRWVMEQYLGRHLSRTEQVHHKNHVKTDNRLENLELVDIAEHSRLHMLNVPLSEKRRRIKIAQENNPYIGLRGEDNGRAKLTNTEVKEIRRLYSSGSHSQRELARRFNISQGSCWQIVNNRQWVSQ